MGSPPRVGTFFMRRSKNRWPIRLTPRNLIGSNPREMHANKKGPAVAEPFVNVVGPAGFTVPLRGPWASGAASAAPSHARLRIGRWPIRFTPRNLIGSSPCGVHVKEKLPLLGA